MEPTEQAPSSAPPKRRRRRWLIVTIALVLMTVSWWCWPRGDARFVGKWEIDPRKGLLAFRSNGTAISYQGAGDRLLSAWRVEGPYLITGITLSDGLGRVMAIAANPLKAATGYRIDRHGEDKYEIVELSKTTIRLRDPDDGEIIRLTRIPE